MRRQLRLQRPHQDPPLLTACSPNVRSFPHSKSTLSILTPRSAQMFIGEMGCWLVVLISHLFRLLRARTSSAPLFKYTPLNGRSSPSPSTSSTLDDETEAPASPSAIHASVSSLDPHAPSAVTKSLLPDSALATHRLELKGWKICLLALPACCDITGTTLMNVGLLFVAASIYQMTRGALVLFVGLFSVLFLRRKLAAYQWSALLIVVLGVAIVGLAGAIQPNPQAKPPPDSLPPASTAEGLMKLLRRGLLGAKEEEEIHAMEAPSAVLVTVLGVLAIALAQTFTASQFVLEEYILERYSLEPIKVVGWEGLFGFLVTVFGMVILHFTLGITPAGRGGYFDAAAGLREIQIPSIAISSVLIMISIGGFNYFGLSITRSVSATARSIIDTCRTLFIWIVSLGLGWESFKWLQILGFAGLVYGTFLFNGIVNPPRGCRRRKEGEEGEGLLADERGA